MAEVALDSRELVDGLEQLALKVVMLDEQDLPGLGSILTHLDHLRAILEPAPASEVGTLLQQMEDVGNMLVLQEIAVAAQGQELLNQGVTLLLNWVRDKKFPSDGEVWNSYCRLCQEVGVAQSTPKEAPPSEEIPTAEAPTATPTPAPAPPPPTAASFAEDLELVGNFIAEAREHLEGIETGLVEMEQSPTDLNAINAVFRPFHTIKGVAGFLDLRQIQELSHDVESLLDETRAGRMPVTGSLIDLILVAVDRLKEMLDDLQDAINTHRPHREFDLEDVYQQIRDVQNNGGAPEPAPQRPLGEILVDQGQITPTELDQALVQQKEETSTPALGEILVKEGKVPPQKVALALVEQMKEEKAPPEPRPAPAPKSKPTTPMESKAPTESTLRATIKIDLGKVDNLVDMMGELVITQSQVRQNPHLLAVSDQKLERDLAQMSRITSELQKISMSMRMIPIGQTFRKMVRLVRDLSRKSRKEVQLYLEGEETEIDRNMVETIYDPLVHLVRNSMDHGLELPQERQAQGKSAEGQLWLRAYHKGGNVVIDIEDDGRGLDKDRILAKAQSRGLVEPTEQLTSAQIYNLIFEAGFSTAEQITEVSGRGVGMDVVRQTIERLHGKIDINSRPGQGCRITLRLPLTLAIIDGLVVRVGQERYIIPAVAVRETLRPSESDYFTVQGQGEVIRVRSQLIPLLRLHRLFRTGQGDLHPTRALVMVVEYEGKQRGLLVDDILGKQEVVIKSLGEVFQKIKGLAGGTILGDGRVGLILDLAGVFALGQA